MSGQAPAAVRAASTGSEPTGATTSGATSYSTAVCCQIAKYGFAVKSSGFQASALVKVACKLRVEQPPA